MAVQNSLWANLGGRSTYPTRESSVSKWRRASREQPSWLLACSYTPILKTSDDQVNKSNLQDTVPGSSFLSVSLLARVLLFQLHFIAV